MDINSVSNQDQYIQLITGVSPTSPEEKFAETTTSQAGMVVDAPEPPAPVVEAPQQAAKKSATEVAGEVIDAHSETIILVLLGMIIVLLIK